MMNVDINSSHASCAIHNVHKPIREYYLFFDLGSSISIFHISSLPFYIIDHIVLPLCFHKFFFVWPELLAH